MNILTILLLIGTGAAIMSLQLSVTRFFWLTPPLWTVWGCIAVSLLSFIIAGYLMISALQNLR